MSLFEIRNKSFQFPRQLRLETLPLSPKILKTQPLRMEKKPTEFLIAFLLQTPIEIQRVARDRMIVREQVYPNLVHASSVRLDAEQCIPAKSFFDKKFRHRSFSRLCFADRAQGESFRFWPRDHAPVFAAVNGKINDVMICLNRAIHENNVFFFYCSMLKLR